MMHTAVVTLSDTTRCSVLDTVCMYLQSHAMLTAALDRKLTSCIRVFETSARFSVKKVMSYYSITQK